MSFLENCIIPLFIQVSCFPIFFFLIKHERLTPLGVLHLYFYSTAFFCVRLTISHMDYFQHTPFLRTEEWIAGIKKCQENIKCRDIEVIGFVTREEVYGSKCFRGSTETKGADLTQNGKIRYIANEVLHCGQWGRGTAESLRSVYVRV